MTKKALLMHWIVFGIVGAIALFLVLMATIVRDQPELPGQWSFHFFQQMVMKAEADRFIQEQQVKHAAWQTAPDLAKEGGFVNSPPCGMINDTALWNTKEDWNGCLPSIEENVFSLLTEKLNKQNVNKGYTSFRFSGTTLRGTSSQPGRVQSEHPFYQEYIFPQDFTIDLGYSFDEYDSLQQEAKRLVNTCQFKPNLKSCLEQNKPISWKFMSCAEERYPAFDQRQIPFCVKSSSLVLNENYQFQPVEYHFAVDFTPGQPFAIENIHAQDHPTPSTLIVSFDPSPIPVEKYTVYFIDSSYGRSLLAQPAFDWKTIPFTVVHQKIDFPTLFLKKECPPDFTFLPGGSSYYCLEQGKVTIILYHTDLQQGKSFFVLVSATANGEESALNTEIEQATMGGSV